MTAAGIGERLFVVTVASEKGGVGKTTIATNLAVYLKALREDLPVTVASFDNHFSVDNMFAIGSHKGMSVADLFSGIPASDLARMGEYGVQFLASERELVPPDNDLRHLNRALSRSRLEGILILDTRPILDYFTRNALLAADLILTPVKDRASLVNAAALHHFLETHGGGSERVRLIPSLVDARLRLRDEIGVREFLTFAARERGYQVLDTFIAKSPKVEGLATNFSSRVYPVLTHARGTVVHGQFRELADFVLQRFDDDSSAVCRPRVDDAAERIPPGRLRRFVRECPLCAREAIGDRGGFYLDMRSRRRGFVHASCLSEILEGTGMGQALTAGVMLVLEAAADGFGGSDETIVLHLYDVEGGGSISETVDETDGEAFVGLVENCAGRSFPEFHRETVFIFCGDSSPSEILSDGGYARFNSMRRMVWRDLSGRVK